MIYPDRSLLGVITVVVIYLSFINVIATDPEEDLADKQNNAAKIRWECQKTLKANGYTEYYKEQWSVHMKVIPNDPKDATVLDYQTFLIDIDIQKGYRPLGIKALSEQFCNCKPLLKMEKYPNEKDESQNNALTSYEEPKHCGPKLSQEYLEFYNSLTLTDFNTKVTKFSEGFENYRKKYEKTIAGLSAKYESGTAKYDTMDAFCTPYFFKSAHNNRAPENPNQEIEFCKGNENARLQTIYNCRRTLRENKFIGKFETDLNTSPNDVNEETVVKFRVFLESLRASNKPIQDENTILSYCSCAELLYKQPESDITWYCGGSLHSEYSKFHQKKYFPDKNIGVLLFQYKMGFPDDIKDSKPKKGPIKIKVDHAIDINEFCVERFFTNPINSVKI